MTYRERISGNHRSLQFLRGGVVGAVCFAIPLLFATGASGETLRVGLKNLPPAKGNPYGAGRGIPNVFTWSALFDSLVDLTEKGVPVPSLATSWDVKDKLTWQFKMRPDVTFSNGEKFDAAAAKTTFDWILSDKGAITVTGRNIASVVESVRVVDPMTIEIKTKSPFPILDKRLVQLIMVAPKAWTDLGVEGFTLRPEGTGSYRVIEFKPNSAEAEAMPKSWRGHKDVTRISFVEIPEGAARNQALISKQLDVDVGPSLDSLEQVTRAGNKVFTYPSPRTLGLTIVSMRKSAPDKPSEPVKTPWADVRVRQAANYAVNKQSIVDNIYGGKATIASQAATTNSFGYNPDIKPYPYDPAKAKALLTEAGYPNGFEAEARTTNTDPTFVNVWESAVRDLNAAGIRTKYLPQTFPDWLKAWSNGDWAWDLVGIGHDLSGELDASQAFTQFSSCLKIPPYYCNEAEMPLVKAAIEEFDPKKREALLRELLAVNAKNAPIIFETEGIEPIAYNGRIKNFKVTNLVINYHEIEFTK